MQIWEMESYPIGDRRLPHHVFPPKFIQSSELALLAGVYLYKVDLDDTMATKKRLTRVKTEWGMTGADVFTVDGKLVDDLKLEEMYEPVESSDDTVCLVLDGDMYYDVEFDDDKWIRMHLQRGDLLIIPKGIFYRSTVTPQNYVKMQRFNKSRENESGL